MSSGENFSLTKLQRRFVDSQSRKKAFIGPHGAGKTFGLLLTIITDARVLPEGSKEIYAFYTPCPEEAAQAAVHIAERDGCFDSYKRVGGRVVQLTNGVRLCFDCGPRMDFAVIPDGVAFDEVSQIPSPAVRETIARVLQRHPDALVLFSATPPVWMDDDVEVITLKGDR
jgi:hypothetical protein